MLWLDRETFSELDLKVVGTYRYAEEAEDLLVSYAVDDGPVRVWDVTAEQMHDELWQAMDDEQHLVTAHNAQFDRAIHNGPKQVHLPPIPLERWRCSMAQALSHALPASLDELGRVLGLQPHMAKMKAGKKLINLFCKPQPANRKVRRATAETHPAEWATFKEYAAVDIVAMRESVRRMPRWNWNASAIAEWHCDQRTNERGFQADRELTEAGARAAEVEKERISVRYREITGGINPGQREKVKAFVKERYNYELEDTTKDTFEQLLKNPDTPEEFAELMRLGIMANKTSTAKYARLNPAIQSDGRFRGGLQFAGASRTRRFAGRMFQAQNLPSRGLPPAEMVELYIYLLKKGDHDIWF